MDRQPLTLVCMLMVWACVSCKADEDRPSEMAQPYLELVERGHPGEHYQIAEITTLEHEITRDGQTMRQDVEVAKQIEVEVVQVDPEGVLTKYRKHFVNYRQRATYRVDMGDAIEEAQIHPLEARTVEYVWRGADGGWEPFVVRDANDSRPLPREDLPEPRSSRQSPLLPESPVRVGDQWFSSELPLSLEGLDPESTRVELTFSELTYSAEEQLARIDIRVVAEPSSTEHLSGALEGFYVFDVLNKHILLVQLGGELSREISTSPVTKEVIRVVTFRAIGENAGELIP